MIGYTQEITRLRERGHVVEARERRVNGKRVTRFVLVSGPSERGTAIEQSRRIAGVNNPEIVSPRSEDPDRLFDIKPEKPKPANAIGGEWELEAA